MCLQIQKVNCCNAYSAKCKNFPACDFSIAWNPLKVHVSRKAHFDYQKKDLINECAHICRISTVKECILTHSSPGTNRLNVEFHNVLQGKVRVVASGKRL